MKIALLAKLKNRLGNKGNYAMRIGRKAARVLDVSRVFIVAAGFLLGLWLMGGPAEVNTQEANADGDLRLVDITTGEVVSLIITPAPSGRLEIFDDADGDGAGEWKGICDDGLETLGTEEDKQYPGSRQAGGRGCLSPAGFLWGDSACTACGTG